MKIMIEPRKNWSQQAQYMSHVGLLVGLSSDGFPLIDYNGNERGPLVARTTIAAADPGDTVLLIFEEGDPTRPIIVGVVCERFENRFPPHLRLAAKEILVEGTEQISIACGESSLTLRKDGWATLKGKEVVSRASRTNRVKGATVKIN